MIGQPSTDLHFPRPVDVARSEAQRLRTIEPLRFYDLICDVTNGTVVKVSPIDKMCSKAVFWGYKAVSESAAPTDNTGTVYLGNAASGGKRLRIPLDPGASYIVEAPLGRLLNLADWVFFGAGATDRLYVEYI